MTWVRRHLGAYSQVTPRHCCHMIFVCWLDTSMLQNIMCVYVNPSIGPGNAIRIRQKKNRAPSENVRIWADRDRHFLEWARCLRRIFHETPAGHHQHHRSNMLSAIVISLGNPAAVDCSNSSIVCVCVFAGRAWEVGALFDVRACGTVDKAHDNREQEWDDQVGGFSRSIETDNCCATKWNMTTHTCVCVAHSNPLCDQFGIMISL